MRIRTYHSDSVESAIRQARVDLGEEAMLLDSKKNPPEQRHLGVYEVRFAIAGAGAAVEPPAGAAAAAGGLSELSKGIDEIRRMLYGYTQTCYLATGEFLSQPQLARSYQHLVASDVSPELAAQLVTGLLALAGRGATPAELERKLAEEIQSLITVSDDIGRGPYRPPVMALVGPAGVGKTTTIAKLAFQFGLRQARRVHLVSTDNHRVAAVAQLETYARILGVKFTAVDEVEGLDSLLQDFQNSRSEPPDLVLIDTPGYSFAELGGSQGLAQFLSSRDDIDTHLVASASTRSKDLRRIIEGYRVFGPRKLLFTKLDETLSFGPLLTETMRTGWPVSFLGSGQKVPDGLTQATKQGLADLLLKQGPPGAEW